MDLASSGECSVAEYFDKVTIFRGHAVAQLVEALRY
jgi:hypothetical protein